MKLNFNPSSWTLESPASSSARTKSVHRKVYTFFMYKSIPLYTYEHDQRYGIYLSFLIRVYFSYGRATKKMFVDTLVKEWFSRETLRKLWDKGQISAHTRVIWGYTIVHSRKDTNFYGSVLPKVSEDILKSVRSLTDLRDFLTWLHAWRPMKIRKDVSLDVCQGRRLKKIGKSTDTSYKSTVCRRVKRACNKFKLQKFHRFQTTTNGNRMQIENAYYFWKVDYIFDKLNGFNGKTVKSCHHHTIEFSSFSSSNNKWEMWFRNFEDIYWLERAKFI